MKAKFAVLLLCSGLMTSGLTFACGGCGDTDACGNAVRTSSCGYDNECEQYAYQYTRGTDCDCSDNGWRYNDCISKCEYCEAFGNIGAR